MYNIFTFFIFSRHNPLEERKVEIVLVFESGSDNRYCYFIFNMTRNFKKMYVKKPKRKTALHINVHNRQVM